jgi:hypothetical protein
MDHDWYTFRVYVDSGADLSLFRKSDAKILGLDLCAGDYHPMMGIGKTLIPAYKHKVKLRIEGTILTALVSFADRMKSRDCWVEQTFSSTSRYPLLKQH